MNAARAADSPRYFVWLLARRELGARVAQRWTSSWKSMKIHGWEHHLERYRWVRVHSSWSTVTVRSFPAKNIGNVVFSFSHSWMELRPWFLHWNVPHKVCDNRTFDFFVLLSTFCLGEVILASFVSSIGNLRKPCKMFDFPLILYCEDWKNWERCVQLFSFIRGAATLIPSLKRSS